MNLSRPAAHLKTKAMTTSRALLQGELLIIIPVSISLSKEVENSHLRARLGCPQHVIKA